MYIYIYNCWIYKHPSFFMLGKVYAVTHKITRKVYACKGTIIVIIIVVIIIINILSPLLLVVRKNSSINDAQSMSTEIEIMKRIRHRNIVSMYELYETPKCLWIILGKSLIIIKSLKYIHNDHHHYDDDDYDDSDYNDDGDHSNDHT